MVSLANRVRDTSTTTGTGAFTLAGAAPAGYETFVQGFPGVTPAVYYVIEAVDASGVPTGAWEIGLGVLSAATTLTRGVLSSSNADALVNFAAGTKNVFCSPPSEYFAAIEASLAALQPLDADLTAIAALTTTAFGRSVLTVANAAALLTLGGLTANGQSLVTAANYAAMKTLLSLTIGTDVQAFNANLTTWAGLAPSANAQSLVTAANYAAMRTLLTLVPGTDFYSKVAADAAFQPLDADLTSIAALTTSLAGRSILTLVDPNVDGITFWDDSAGAMAFLTLGTNLTITGTTLDAAGSGTAASQAEQEAASDTTKFVSPGRQHFHPSAAKFWAVVAANGATLTESYNVTSHTDGGLGNLTITIATDFSTATWCAILSGYVDITSSTPTFTASRASTKAAGTIVIVTEDNTNTAADPTQPYGIVGFGDQ